MSEASTYLKVKFDLAKLECRVFRLVAFPTDCKTGPIFSIDSRSPLTIFISHEFLSQRNAPIPR